MQGKPLYRFDKKKLGDNMPGLIGIDEAGRGCFAGPVVAGAVWIQRKFYEHLTPIRRAPFITDSKQISAETREEIFALIEHWERKGELLFAAGSANVNEIEIHNILGASRLAMQRAVAKILEKYGNDKPCPFASAGADDAPLFCSGKAFPLMLVDGKPLVPFAWRHEAIVKGDSTSLAIALASIVAKVTRDHLMCELDTQYPDYKFAEHKGYGTASHIAALKKYGITPHHRIKFLRNLAQNSPKTISGLEKLLPQPDIPPAQSEFSF